MNNQIDSSNDAIISTDYIDIFDNVKDDWLDLIIKNDFIKIYDSILLDKSNSDILLPFPKQILETFKYFSIKDTKCVILGQDPYYKLENNIPQACGLSFSVAPGIKIPPSLRNIYKLIINDLGLKAPKHGNLSKWVSQNVLLLNSSLTVFKDKPGCHMKYWAKLTDTIIEEISNQNPNCVFILLGKFAQSKKFLINPTKHLIITADHPSPLGVTDAFYKSNIFSKTNQWLINHNISPIDWQL